MTDEPSLSPRRTALDLLREARMTEAEFARAVGRAPSTVFRWFHTKTKMPPAERAWLARCAEWHRKNQFRKECEQ